jgi:hypothetical protein
MNQQMTRAYVRPRRERTFEHMKDLLHGSIGALMLDRPSDQP